MNNKKENVDKITYFISQIQSDTNSTWMQLQHHLTLTENDHAKYKR